MCQEVVFFPSLCCWLNPSQTTENSGFVISFWKMQLQMRCSALFLHQYIAKTATCIKYSVPPCTGSTAWKTCSSGVVLLVASEWGGWLIKLHLICWFIFACCQWMRRLINKTTPNLLVFHLPKAPNFVQALWVSFSPLLNKRVNGRSWLGEWK